RPCRVVPGGYLAGGPLVGPSAPVPGERVRPVAYEGALRPAGGALRRAAAPAAGDRAPAAVRRCGGAVRAAARDRCGRDRRRPAAVPLHLAAVAVPRLGTPGAGERARRAPPSAGSFRQRLSTPPISPVPPPGGTPGAWTPPPPCSSSPTTITPCSPPAAATVRSSGRRCSPS